jgi:hypothetical protein
MSQYVKIQVEVRDKALALAALEALGFRVRCSDAGDLHPRAYASGYGWRERADIGAHILVTRDQINCCANDFAINLDTGEVFMDEEAKRSKLCKFLQEYAAQVAIKAYVDQGRYYERVDDPESGKVWVYARGES